MVYNPYNSFMGQQQTPYYFSWVQGEAGAKALMPQPGMTAVMLDTENPVLYMKYTDPTGRPQEMQKRYLVTEEEYRKYQNSDVYVTKEEFDKLAHDVNEMKESIHESAV